MTKPLTHQGLIRHYIGSRKSLIFEYSGTIVADLKNLYLWHKRYCESNNIPFDESLHDKKMWEDWED